VITVAGSNKLLSQVTKSFIHWTISHSSPCTWLEVATSTASSYNKVIIKSGDQIIYYERKKDESIHQFKSRIFRKSSDEMTKEIDNILKGKGTESKKIWLYYGNGDFSTLKLPQGSIIVDPKKVTGDTSLIHLDDPYKVFYLK